jgi:hypothetical protein
MQLTMHNSSVHDNNAGNNGGAVSLVQASRALIRRASCLCGDVYIASILALYPDQKQRVWACIWSYSADDQLGMC